MEINEIMQQMAYASAYYLGLIAMVRLAGKRLAGQTTTFDLIVLISLGVTLQSLTLMPGKPQALTFIITVFVLHRGLAMLCARSPLLKKIFRGGPRVLVRKGKILEHALEDEGLSREDLLAALRKLGFPSAETIELAILEETGHVSAIEKKTGDDAHSQKNDKDRLSK